MKVAVVGTGVIGISWTAHFLAYGLDVVATDPAPDAEERLRAGVAAIGLSPLDRLTFTADAGRPRLRRTSSRRTAPSARTSSTPCSRCSTRPPAPTSCWPAARRGCCPASSRGAAHTIPSAWWSGTRSTRRTSSRSSRSCRASTRRRPPSSRRWRSTPRWGRDRSGCAGSCPGHIANRLQAALWQEAYSLVERGVASVADIDTAIAQGPGLRWALLGPFANQHLSGGPGGIAHILEHLGPPTEAWWRDLGQVHMTPELEQKIITGVDEELAGVDPADLAARRDAVLRTLLAAKEEGAL